MENELMNTLSGFIEEFQSRNYLFLTESDIKCRLYSLLSDNYNKIPLKLSEYLTLINQDFLYPLVTSEYAYIYKDVPNEKYFRHTSKKMDLAILDKEYKDSPESLSKTIEPYNVKEENYFGFLPVKYGIELNYCRTDNILDDAVKLKEYSYVNSNSFQGIVIQFHRKSNVNQKDKNYFINTYKFKQTKSLIDIINDKRSFKILILAVFPDTIFYEFDKFCS